jgi:molybdenum cofactor biosynthesis protein B
VSDAVPRQHKGHAAARRVRFGLLTVSDSRTPATDEGGALLAKLAEEAGHAVVARALVPDEAIEIRRAVEAMLGSDAEILVTTGGTGVARRDVTVDAVAPLFERALPGFGEIFRALSYSSVGSAAMMSRAEAGVARGKAIFLLPGSPDACRLAMERLILPEAAHLASLLGR